MFVVGLALVPSAIAGTGSSLDGYGGNASTPVVQVKGAHATKTSTAAKPAAAKPAASGQLPFTGANLMWFVIAGGALVAVGVGLRMFGSDRS
jgi:hypothetical protein